MKPVIIDKYAVIDPDCVDVEKDQPEDDIIKYPLSGIYTYHHDELMDVLTKLSSVADRIIDTLAEINDPRCDWYVAPDGATAEEIVEFKSKLQPFDGATWAYYLSEPSNTEGAKLYIDGKYRSVGINANALSELVDVVKYKLYGAIDPEYKGYQWDSTENYALMLDPFTTEASQLLIQLIAISNDSAWNEAFCHKTYTLPLTTLLNSSSSFWGLQVKTPKACLTNAVDWFQQLVTMKMYYQVKKHGSKWDPMYGDWDDVDGEAFDDGGYL